MVLVPHRLDMLDAVMEVRSEPLGVERCELRLDELRDQPAGDFLRFGFAVAARGRFAVGVFF